MNTIKCVLLDDELPGLKYLRMLCEQIPNVEVVKAFNDPIKYLDEKELDYDLCILDIEMPKMNGLQLARLIKHKPVIFTTAYKEYAADAFDLEAIDYIQKPIKKDRLERAFEKVRKVLQDTSPTKRFIQVTTNKGKALLFTDQILYVTTAESDSRDKVVTLEDGKEIIIKNVPFNKLLDLLPVNEFCRVNKKQVIAIKVVSYFTHAEIQTRILQPGGKPLTFPLSENFSSGFLEKVLTH